MADDWVSPADGGSRIRVRVQPRASRTEIVGFHDGALKIRVTAPPVGGAANDELVAFLAKRLRAPKTSIRVESGGRGRLKTVRLDGWAPDAIRRSLLGS